MRELTCETAAQKWAIFRGVSRKFRAENNTRKCQQDAEIDPARRLAIVRGESMTNATEIRQFLGRFFDGRKVYKERFLDPS